MDTVIRTATTLSVRVIQMRWEAYGVTSLLLAPVDGGSLPPWTAGDHIDVHLPGDRVRQYSLCGDSAKDAPWRIAVLRVADGRGGSIAVHDVVRVGDVIEVGLPRNNFGLQPAGGYLFLAGGIGITPILSMIKQAEGEGIPWQLFYGGRSLPQMAFASEVSALNTSAAPHRVQVVPKDIDGRLPVAQLLRDPIPNTLVFCCGPASMRDSVADAMAHWPAGSLVIERFAPEAAAVDEQEMDSPEFEVQAALSGVSVRVAPGISIVQALENAGVNVSTSCGQGICGTCETRVLAGVPEHHDSLLTEDERESNETMMICVGRAKSDTLVLEI